jgi:hypothetical protein
MNGSSRLGFIDVIEEAEALQDVQCPRAVAHPVGIPPDRLLPRRLDDALDAVGDEATLGIGIEPVAVLPGAAMRSGLVATTHDFASEVRLLVDRLADHEGGELDPVLIEQVENTGDAFIDAALEEGVRRQVRQTVLNRIGDDPARARDGLTARLEHQ